MSGERYDQKRRVQFNTDSVCNTEVIEQQGLQSQATTVLTFMESKVAFWEHLMKAL